MVITPYTSTPQQHDEATLSLQVAGQQEASSSASLYSFSIQSSGGGSEGYDAVGNVTGYTDSVNGSWSFTYDSLNRLATAAGSQDNNPYPNYCWQYDSFGNRLAQSSSSTAYSSSSGGANSCPSGSGSQSSASYNANNQISDGLHQYDAAGDLTQDATTGNLYLYDGEGRVCAVRQSIVGLALMTQYLYDAEGHRVAKGSISTFSCDTTTNGFTATTVYVLGPSGEQMTEMANNSGAWQWAHTNVYAPGLSATYDADLTGQTEGKMYFHLSDWLGTRRQQTDYAGNPVLNFTGLPYGDGLATIPVSNTDAADATEHHFTAKERDSESGNDYFGARYYASSMGRFLSPDYSDDSDGPQPVPYANLEDPQGLNLYAYAGNNPLTNVDPDGHLDCSGGATQDVACAVTAAAKAVWGWLTSGGGGSGSNNGDTGPSSPPPNNPGFMPQLQTRATQASNWAHQQAWIPPFLGGKPTPPVNGHLRIENDVILFGPPSGLSGMSTLLNSSEVNAINGVLKQIATGATKGVPFENAATAASGGANPLPIQGPGYYTRYVVSFGSGKGGARIVTGLGGEIYATFDHYISWMKLR